MVREKQNQLPFAYKIIFINHLPEKTFINGLLTGILFKFLSLKYSVNEYLLCGIYSFILPNNDIFSLILIDIKAC